MEMRNCPKCGKVFTYTTKSICPDCIKEEENSFEIVRLFIKENPSCKLSFISEETGISFKKIMSYIKEGKIEATSGMEGEISCEKCGKPVTKGRYCDSCALKIDAQVKTMFGKKSILNGTGQKPAAIMHTQRDK